MVIANPKTNLHDQEFLSPSRGRQTFAAIIYDILETLKIFGGNRVVVSVGTDSEDLQGVTKFVSVIVVWTVGHGAHGFRILSHALLPAKMEKAAAMRSRITQETILTGTLAQELRSALRDAHGGELPVLLEVHADVGPNGGTSVMMREVIGMFKGYGFHDYEIKVKPESYAASSVADHYI